MVRIINHPEVFRSNVRSELNCRYFCTDVVKGQKHAKNLEIGIYNWTVQNAKLRKIIVRWNNSYFVRLYENKLKMIIDNFNVDNPYINLLKARILDRTIKVHKIAFMTHMELRPDKWEKLLIAQNIKKMQTNEVKYESNTNAYLCENCGMRNCSFYTLQTRSADEGMTCYVTCLTPQCGNKWKTD